MHFRSILFLSSIFLVFFTKSFAQPDENIVNKFIHDWKIPGASIAIAKDERLVYAKGFGYADKERKQAVVSENIFRIASISKFITSVAILKLMEEGKLKIDGKVFGPSGILNDEKYSVIRDKRVCNITVRNLLQHAGGWDRNISGDPMFDFQGKIIKTMDVKYPAGQVSIIRYMLRQKLDFAPGSRYSYSNFGYCVLGRVIEKITGMSYENYISSALFRPLDIIHTRLGRNFKCDRLPDEVNYYDEEMAASCLNNGSKVSIPYGGFNLEAMDAHGGWVASASDLLKLLMATDGSPIRPDIIHSSSVELMKTPSVCNCNYAMGCEVNSLGNIWHTGALPGTSSMVARLSNGISWVILLNGRPSDPHYFQALDALMWNVLHSIKTWPVYDLFKNTTKEFKKAPL
jgi:CubicO group peptidase (beta-lactamase class C family)